MMNLKSRSTYSRLCCLFLALSVVPWSASGSQISFFKLSKQVEQMAKDNPSANIIDLINQAVADQAVLEEPLSYIEKLGYWGGTVTTQGCTNSYGKPCGTGFQSIGTGWRWK